MTSAPRTARVATVRCRSYELVEVRAAVRRCTEALPELQERFDAAESVLLKPNLLSSSRGPDKHVNTHPALVRALAEMLIAEFGCRVAVGDSCGTLTEGSTAAAIRISGMEEVCRQTGASLYNVDMQPRRTEAFDRGELYRNIPLPANLADFDLIVSVAKLKTHSLTGVTGPVKNIFGLVPGAGKKHGHLLAPRADRFAALLCDLYDRIRPRAAFVDGVIGMEGRGPANGALKRADLIAASADPVALDSFCAQVMGFDPLVVPLLARCHERELGVADPRCIEVIGEAAESFTPGGFVRPPTYLSGLTLRLLPGWVFRGLFGALTTRYARVNQEKCVRCGQCALNCPSKAISREEGSGNYVVDRRKCISCYCCAEVCPADAIDIVPARLLRALRRVRRPFG